MTNSLLLNFCFLYAMHLFSFVFRVPSSSDLEVSEDNLAKCFDNTNFPYTTPEGGIVLRKCFCFWSRVFQNSTEMNFKDASLKVW